MRPNKRMTLNSLPMVSNEDGFFDGLPLLPASKQKGTLRMTKAERKQMKLKLFELRQEELNLKMDALREDIAIDEDEEAEKNRVLNGLPVEE